MSATAQQEHTQYGDDGPAVIPPMEVVKAFRAVNRPLVDTAREDFGRLVNLDPAKFRDLPEPNSITWAFEEWFSFDVVLERPAGHDRDQGERSGGSPYRIVAEQVIEDMPFMTPRYAQDLRNVDRTNIASWFWIAEANAVRKELVLEDLVHGGTYVVNDPIDSAELDGADHGFLVTRLARPRDTWMRLGETYYRTTDANTTVEARKAVGEALSSWKPDFPSLIRLLFGRSPDLGMDWVDLEAYASRHGRQQALDLLERSMRTAGRPGARRRARPRRARKAGRRR